MESIWRTRAGTVSSAIEDMRMEKLKKELTEADLQDLRDDADVFEAFRQMVPKSMPSTSFVKQLYKIIKLSKSEYGIAAIDESGGWEIVIRGMDVHMCNSVFYALHIANNWDFVNEDLGHLICFRGDGPLKKDDVSQLQLKSNFVKKLTHLMDVFKTNSTAAQDQS
jgi:hypothetical protein